MLQMLEVVTERGETLDLPLEDPQEGYVIQDIEGLDPVKATIVSSSFANIDGVQYQSSRREGRTVIIKLDLKPDYISTTVRALRTRLYGYFMPKSNVLMRFTIEGEGVVEIYGRVESFVSPIFVKEPFAHITLLCEDSDFIDPTPVIFNGVTNDTGEESELVYNGSVETGFKLTLTVDRALNSFTMNHRAGDGMFATLDFIHVLQAGDTVEISTVTGDKYAHFTRVSEGTTFEGSILYAVAPHSSWINLFPGINHIRIYAEGLGIPYTIEYTNKIGGL